MKEVIEQEIKWCEENRGMNSKEFEDGFIAGLKQVLFFINSTPESEHVERMDEVTKIKKYNEWYDITVESMRGIEAFTTTELLQRAFSAGVEAAEYSAHVDEMFTCPACKGLGYLPKGWQPICGQCAGSGQVKTPSCR